MATKKTSSSSKSSPVTIPGGGLKVTTDQSGKITGASDSSGSFSVDSGGKATRISSTPAPAAAPAVVAKTPAKPVKSPMAQYYEGLDTKVPDAKAEKQIRAQKLSAMQGTIDAIKAGYASLVQQENVVGQDRMGRTGAINARSGNIGSDFGNTALSDTERYNKQQLTEIENEQASKISAIMADVENRAQAEIAARRAEALGNQEKVAAYYEKAQADAKSNVEMLAKTGLDLSTLDPNKKAQLMRETGMDELSFDQIFNYYAGERNKIDWKFETIKGEDGSASILAYGLNPKTGQLESRKYDAGITGGQIPKIIDGQPYILQRNDDGSMAYVKVPGVDPKTQAGIVGEYEYAKSQGYTGSFIQYQNEDANRKLRASAGGGGGTQTQQKGAFMANARAALEANRGQDGKVNPDLYRDLRNEYERRFGSASSFVSSFPTSTYLTTENQQKDLAPRTGSDILSLLAQ